MHGANGSVYVLFVFEAFAVHYYRINKPLDSVIVLAKKLLLRL